MPHGGPPCACLPAMRPSRRLPAHPAWRSVALPGPRLVQVLNWRHTPLLRWRRSPLLRWRRSPLLNWRHSPLLCWRRYPVLGRRRTPLLSWRRTPLLCWRRAPLLNWRRTPLLNWQGIPLHGSRHALTRPAVAPPVTGAWARPGPAAAAADQWSLTAGETVAFDSNTCSLPTGWTRRRTPCVTRDPDRPGDGPVSRVRQAAHAGRRPRMGGRGRRGPAPPGQSSAIAERADHARRPARSPGAPRRWPSP